MALSPPWLRRSVVDQCAVLLCVKNDATPSRDVPEVMGSALRVDVFTVDDGVDVSLHRSEVGHQLDAVVTPVPQSVFGSPKSECFGCFDAEDRRHELELRLSSSSDAFGIGCVWLEVFGIRHLFSSLEFFFASGCQHMSSLVAVFISGFEDFTGVAGRERSVFKPGRDQNICPPPPRLMGDRVYQNPAGAGESERLVSSTSDQPPRATGGVLKDAP